MNAKQYAPRFYKALRDRGYDGAWEYESVAAWMEDNGMDSKRVAVKGTDATLDVKKVVVSYDPAVDDLEVMEIEEPEPDTEDMDGDDDEKAGDNDEDKMDDDEDRKSRRASKSSARKRAVGIMTAAGTPSSADRMKKAYDRKVKRRGVGPGRFQAKFYDADQAEQYVAASRLMVMGQRGYKMRAHDERVLQKAGSTQDLTAGGSLVPTEIDTVVMDLAEEFGVVRQLVSFEPMISGQKQKSRIVNTTNDSNSNESGGITAAFTDENGSITASDANTGMIELIARKLASLTRQPSEILEDSFINIADKLAELHARAHVEKEDDTYFNGDGSASYGSIVGILEKFYTMGTNPEDAAGAVLASGNTWDEITIEDILKLMGTLPSFGGADPVFTCSREFKHQVLYKFQHESERSSAIARSTADFTQRPVDTVLGVPVVTSQKMPQSASNDTIPLLYGDHNQASSCGDVTGSTEFAQSSDRYFEQDQVAFRMRRRIAMLPGHDIGTTSNAGAVVGLIMEDS